MSENLQALLWYSLFQCPCVVGVILLIERYATGEWRMSLAVKLLVALYAVGMLIYFYYTQGGTFYG